MAVYSASGQQATLTSALKSFITLACPAASMRRFKVFDINVSQGAAPASTDTNIEFNMARYTGTVGIGTAFTPPATDIADAETRAPCLFTLTAEQETDPAHPLFNFFLN